MSLGRPERQRLASLGGPACAEQAIRHQPGGALDLAGFNPLVRFVQRDLQRGCSTFRIVHLGVHVTQYHAATDPPAGLPQEWFGRHDRLVEAIERGQVSCQNRSGREVIRVLRQTAPPCLDRHPQVTLPKLLKTQEVKVFGGERLLVKLLVDRQGPRLIFLVQGRTGQKTQRVLIVRGRPEPDAGQSCSRVPISPIVGGGRLRERISQEGTPGNKKEQSSDTQGQHREAKGEGSSRRSNSS